MHSTKSLQKQQSQTDSHALIQQYKQTGDVKYRNDLIMRHIDIVRYSALSIRNMAAKFADFDDLVNEGVISLMNAIETFDETKGAKFETYASLKVRGGLIDFIRKQDWVPRNVRRFSKELDFVFTQLFNELGRVPEDQEIAEKMDMSLEKFQKALSQTSGIITLSFEELIFEDNLDNLAGLGDTASDRADAPLFEKELKEIIRKAIDELKPKEKQVIMLYYYKRLKFSDIAKIIGVTESRISQIHAKTMLTLKAKLEGYT